MLTQTLALFIDSYRELSAKKIFWLTMGISGLIVLMIAAVGMSDDGSMTILWFETSLPLGDLGLEKGVFYKVVFVNLGFRFWLAWGATILALASTAGIFPDFISGGAIDLALSKPIGRVRLLLTKYVASLLFVALQVAVFSLCAFLVIGIRGGAWEPAGSARPSCKASRPSRRPCSPPSERDCGVRRVPGWSEPSTNGPPTWGALGRPAVERGRPRKGARSCT